eukprot:365506-Chlamydomonas_euryale.AAC.3
MQSACTSVGARKVLRVPAWRPVCVESGCDLPAWHGNTPELCTRRELRVVWMQALESNRSLTSLELSEMCLSDDAVKELAKVWKVGSHGRGAGREEGGGHTAKELA